MISYCGIPLVDPEPAELDYLERRLASVPEFEQATWPGRDRQHWTVPGTLPMPPLRLQTLTWPRGASRWAVGHFLATSNELQHVRQAVYSSGSSTNKYAAGLLKLDDGTRSVSTLMYLLPPRPLDQVTDFQGQIARGENGLYLLTLVDERYFWPRRGDQIDVQEKATTWTELLGDIAEALGITLVIDTVHADYLYPSGGLLTQATELPALLDGVAYNCGLRIVRELDGTVRAQSADNALLRCNQLLLLQGWRRHAGGRFLFDPIRDAPQADLAGAVPQYVRVMFRPTRDVERTCDPYEAEVSLASLALTQFVGVVGHAGTKLFHDACYPNFQRGTPTNDTELDALAARVARDWYLWQLGGFDLDESGLVPWDGEALDDLVVWSHRPDRLTTRVLRPAWNDLTEQLHHASSTYGSNWTVVDSRAVEVTDQDYDQGYQTGVLSHWDGDTAAWVADQSVWVRDARDDAEVLPLSRFDATLEGCREGRPVYAVRAVEGEGSDPSNDPDDGCYPTTTSWYEWATTCYSGTNTLMVMRQLVTLSFDGCRISRLLGPWEPVQDTCVLCSCPCPDPCSCGPPSPGCNSQWWCVWNSVLCTQPPCPIVLSCVQSDHQPDNYLSGPYDSPGICDFKCAAWWCVWEEGLVKCVFSSSQPANALSGPYQSPHSCSPNCTPPWWCVPVNGVNTCVQSLTEPAGQIGGPYAFAGACAQPCSMTSHWWCYSNGGSPACIQQESPPSGTLSGPYDNASQCAVACTVALTCPCTDPPLPSEPLATLVNVSDCACGHGNSTGLSGGTGVFPPPFCGTAMRQLSLSLDCTGGAYVLHWSFNDADFPACDGDSGTAVLLTGGSYTPSCNPLSLWFEFRPIGTCCNGVGTSPIIRVHVTEAP